VRKAQGKTQKGRQPAKVAVPGSEKVKVNELGTGADGGARPSTPARPRMRDIEGGKTEGPTMNEEKQNAAPWEGRPEESETKEEDNDEIRLLARIIFAESAQDYDKPGAMEGVGWTVRNRVESGDFGGKTYQDVIFAPRQFNAVGGPLWRKADDPSTMEPEDAKAYARALEVARGVYRGTVPDPTNGSIGFHSFNRKDFPGNPNWQYIGPFGSFKFFKR